MVVIISDCFGDIPSILKGLAHFNHAKHDVVVFQIWHRDELNFLFVPGRDSIALKMPLRRTVDPAHLKSLSPRI